MAIPLTKYLHTQNGKYIMSIILGFGLATIFRTVCKDKNCLIFRAPPLEEIENKIYKFHDKCYTYSQVSQKCNKSKRIINME